MENKDLSNEVEIMEGNPSVLPVIRISEKDIERRNQELRKKELEEIEQNLKKGEDGEKNKFALIREQIGKKVTKLGETIRKSRNKIVAGGIAIGLVGISIAISTACSNKNDKDKEIESNLTSITDESMEEATKDIEKEGITIPTEETTKPAMTSVNSSNTESTPEEEKEPIEETVNTTSTTSEEKTPIETTATTTTKPASTTQTPVDVTKPVSTTPVSTPEEKTPVETTTTTITKPAETTVVTEEEKEPVIKVEAIQIEDFAEKKQILKEELEKAGIYASDELIENTIRVLHSDFIEHDGLGEITAVKYEQTLSLLASVGSVNCGTFSAGYMGYIASIEEGFYIPAEILPESSQAFQKAIIKVSEAYRLGLNKSPIMIEGLTSEEEQQIIKDVMEELDKLNIKNDNEYSQKFGELYNEKWIEISNSKIEEQQTTHDENSNKEYKELYTNVLELVNSKEYEALTPAEKLVVFTNIAGAMTSGMQEQHIGKFESFQKGIESSVDQVREDLIVANRMNVSQQEALNKIVENNKSQVQQERDDLKNIIDIYENLYESLYGDGKVLTK